VTGAPANGKSQASEKTLCAGGMAEHDRQIRNSPNSPPKNLALTFVRLNFLQLPFLVNRPFLVRRQTVRFDFQVFMRRELRWF